MANKILHESKHILKRVLLGVATGVLATSVIYFLYNKKPKASEAEVRKATIAAWKTYVSIENETQQAFDSSFTRLNREMQANKEDKRNMLINEFCQRDSATALKMISSLTSLKEKGNLDKDFSILLGTRIAYQRQQALASLKFARRVQAVLDSSIEQWEKNSLMTTLNTANTERLNNLTIRIGRNIEYFVDVLSRKYKYPFDFSDISYYPGYMSLKRTKINKPATVIAPPDPDAETE